MSTPATPTGAAPSTATIPLLDEAKLASLSVEQRAEVVLKWLTRVDDTLKNMQRADAKAIQPKLQDALVRMLLNNPGPAERRLVLACITSLSNSSGTVKPYDIVAKCQDFLRAKEAGSPVSPRLGALECVGLFYKTVGRQLGGIFLDSVALMLKIVKAGNDAPQIRAEATRVLAMIVESLGSSGSSSHKEILKSVKPNLSDKSMLVRIATAKAIASLADQQNSAVAAELESTFSNCVKGFDGADVDARRAIADCIADVFAAVQSDKGPQGSLQRSGGPAPSAAGLHTPQEVLSMLASPFSKGSREVRVGLAHAFVAFLGHVGRAWVARNQSAVTQALFDSLSAPKWGPNPSDASAACTCIAYVLRNAVTLQLGESSQVGLVLDLCRHVGRLSAGDPSSTPYALSVALGEIGALLRRMGMPPPTLYDAAIEPVFAVLSHPSPTARLAAAWCLRTMALTAPAKLAAYAERCTEVVRKERVSSARLAGHAWALASLMSAVSLCPLGVPHTVPKTVMAVAEELLRIPDSATSATVIEAGWGLIASLMSLGPTFVKDHLRKLFLLWREVLPRTTKEREAERMRALPSGLNVLRSRSCALLSIHAFVVGCPTMLTSEVSKRVVGLLNNGLLMLVAASAVRATGEIRQIFTLARQRLYTAFAGLPKSAYEGSCTTLIRLLVADLTLVDSPDSGATLTILRSLCHETDVALDPNAERTDYSSIEDLLAPGAVLAYSAMENDPYNVVYAHEQGRTPQPPPAEAAVLDAAVSLFASVFPGLSPAHRQEVAEHFVNCADKAKQSSGGQRLAIQSNCVAAISQAIKAIADAKGELGAGKPTDKTKELLLGSLVSPDPTLRSLAADTLGRLAVVIGDSLVAETMQLGLERLQADRDPNVRAGFSLVLGAINRYVGSIGATKHLKSAVAILTALANDPLPTVQTWALHGLRLTMDSAGLNFSPMVSSMLSLVAGLLSSDAHTASTVRRSLGAILNGVIGTLGPELQASDNSRALCVVLTRELQESADPSVRAEGMLAIQQIILFAPQKFNIADYVPYIRGSLASSHLPLRQAALTCVRQLAQRDAATLSARGSEIEMELFGMLDTEAMPHMRAQVREAISCLMAALASERPSYWLALVNDRLTATTDENAAGEGGAPGAADASAGAGGAGGDEDEDDQDGEGMVSSPPPTDAAAKAPNGQAAHAPRRVTPGWEAKVFAMECFREIIRLCGEKPAHFDLALARAARAASPTKDLLVLRLSELVRTAFNAATSTMDALALHGLGALETIISRFASAEDPDVEGQALLEQYQAQIGAALRPAFGADVSPTVTAAACQVCAQWISSGVSRNVLDLRKVQGLLVTLLDGMETYERAAFNESAATMVRLALLTAWARIYVVSRTSTTCDYLGEMVEPFLARLSRLWMDLLKDAAVIGLPEQYLKQLPGGGAFYASGTRDKVQPYYDRSWPTVVYAVSLLMDTPHGSLFVREAEPPAQPPAAAEGEAADAQPEKKEEKKEAKRGDSFYLVFGLCVQALSVRSEPSTVTMCLRTLQRLFRPSPLFDDPSDGTETMGLSMELYVELLAVLHRLVQTQEVEVQLLAMEAVHQLVKSSGWIEPPNALEVRPGRSRAFATLDVCACVLLRQIPTIDPSFDSRGQSLALSSDALQLVAVTLSTLASLPSMVPRAIGLQILPTALFLTGGVLRCDDANAASLALKALRTLVSLPVDGVVEHDVPQATILQCALSAFCDSLEAAIKAHGVKDARARTGLLGLAVFVLCAPPEVWTQELEGRYVACLRQVLQGGDAQGRLAAVQTLLSFVQLPDFPRAVPYVQSLVSDIVSVVAKAGLAPANSEAEVAVVTDSLRLLEALFAQSGEHAPKVLALIIPLLVPFLRLSTDPKPLPQHAAHAAALHTCALAALLQLAPTKPDAFRAITASLPADRRARLEAAIREDAERARKAEQKKAAVAAKVVSQPSTPSIQLKMDFSNFK